MKPNHILLATDLSSASWRGIPHAARLAWLNDGEVTVAWAGEAGDAEGALLAKIREGLEQMDVRVRCEAVSGPVVPALLALAKARGADVIVTTKHGINARGDVIGSVTDALLRKSPVPVLVAHDPLSYDAPPRTKPAQWRRITVSTDFSAVSQLGVLKAAALCRDTGAALEVVSVVVDPRCPLEVDAEGVRWPALPTDLQGWRDRCALLLQELKIPDVKVTLRAVAAHEAGAAIIAAALESGSDLIVVPAHGRGTVESMLLGSTSERVLQLSPLPVLVLRGLTIGS